MIAVTLIVVVFALAFIAAIGTVLDSRDEYERQSQRQLLRELARYDQRDRGDR